jgi:hypothetical protein
MPSEELRILLGEPAALAGRVPPHSRGWHGWFVYPGHSLKSSVYLGFAGGDEFRSSPAVVAWNELALGTPLRSNVTYSAHEAPLAGIVATQSAESTRSWIEALFAAASVRTDNAAVPELKNVA